MIGPNIVSWFRFRELNLHQLQMISACIAMLSLGLSPASAESLSPSSLNFVDLVLNWNSYKNRTIFISGPVHCDNEDYCRFREIPELRRVASIDINNLSQGDKKFMVFRCHSYDCNLVIKAVIDGDEIIALEIDK